jgi:hypothetical protein
MAADVSKLDTGKAAQTGVYDFTSYCGAGRSGASTG